MAILDELVTQIENPDLRARIAAEVEKLAKQKKFGLVFEEHLPECTPLWDIPVKKGGKVALKTGQVSDFYTVLQIEDGIATCLNKDKSATAEFKVDELVSVAEFGEPIYPYLKPIDKVCNAPDSDLWHTLIEADNYHALQLLEYLYAGKVDCIYIDPPYNTGARDWKYNNDYVDNTDQYRHSKWLSFMQKRLKLAKMLLNPEDSVLIVTIDEKEYLHLGCLLEEMFPEAEIQMVSSAINGKGVSRGSEFFRVNEYLFFVKIGNCSVAELPLQDEWLGNIKTSTTKQVRWGSLMRSGSGSDRKDSPGCFYPIYISKDKTHFCGAGEVVPVGVDRNTVKTPDNVIAIFPIHDDGTEGRWQYSREKYLELQAKGYARISTQTKKEATIRYISEGWQKRVESGEIKVMGNAEDGSLIFDDDEYEQKYIPGNQWWIASHDATEFGSKLLNKMIGKRFSFPKSLYAVHDAIRFFVANKPDALIVDFFAGSGTTLHAVMQLNAEDGGKRQCILCTNNENGICENVTYERNKRVIEGYTKPNGEEVAGLADNNLRYYRTEFLPRERSVKNMRELVQASTGLLCIKNDLYTEAPFGGRKMNPTYARYFEHAGQRMLVIYEERGIPFIADIIKTMPEGEKIKVYVFSHGSYAYDDEFAEVADRVELCALPQAIYDAYQKVLPKRKPKFLVDELVEEIVENNDAEETKDGLFGLDYKKGGDQ